MAVPRIYEQWRGASSVPRGRAPSSERERQLREQLQKQNPQQQLAAWLAAEQQGLVAPGTYDDHPLRAELERRAEAQRQALIALAQQETQRQEGARQARLDATIRRAQGRATAVRERSRQIKQAQAMNFVAPGINTAYRTATRARMGAAAVTARNKKDDSLVNRGLDALRSVPGIGSAFGGASDILRAADTPRRAFIAGALELGDAAEKVAGRENRDTRFGRARVRDTGFSWEDFKRNTFDDDKNIGFGDIYQEGLNRTGTEDTPLGNPWVKRGVGFVGDVATDPLTYVPFGLAGSGLSKPTLRAGSKAFAKGADVIPEGVRRSQANLARDALLTESRRGRAIEAEVRRVAAATTDAGEAMRRLPGLAPTTAREIANAPTRELAQEVASRALRTGEYIPDISLRRQALLATTGRGLRAPGGLGLGKRVVRESEGLLDIGGKVRRLANNAPGGVAVTRTTSTAQARRAAVRASLLRVGVRTGDAREMVAEASVGMTPWDRVNQALIDIESTPGIVADVVESTLESILPRAKDPVEFNRAMTELVNDADAMEALLEAETLIATARGDFGEEAAKALRTELGVGFSRPGDVDALQVIQRAGNRAGLSLPKPKLKSATDTTLKTVAKQIDDVSDEALRAELRAALAKVDGGKKGATALNRIAHVAALAADDEVAADAAGMLGRYGDTLAGRAELVGGARLGLGQRVNPARKLGKVLTSVSETIVPGRLRFLSTENAELALQERVKAFDSYMGALGLDDNARAWGRQAVADVQAEADLYRVVDNTLAVLADAEGVPADILSDLLRKTQGEARDMGFKAGAGGELLDEVQNLSQLTETVALPNPADVNRTVRELRKAMDDPSKLAEIRKYLDDPSDTRRIARGFAWLHRTWKLLIVTNLYMPVVGGFVGFTGEDGDFDDRLKSGFQWAALGALAPSRYIARIGIEETARRVLLRGFVPTEFIPGIAKWRASRGVDRPLMSAHLLSSGDPTGNWIRNELATRATGEYAAMALPNRDGVFAKLGRRHSRYVDSWWRIVNYEINPANGGLDRILLGHRAGYLTRKQADEWFQAFLTTDEGKTWWRRWKGAHGAPRTPAEAFKRQLKFVEDYVPADIAAVRLPAMDSPFQEVPRSLLKGKVKEAQRASGVLPVETPARDVTLRDRVKTVVNEYPTTDAGTLLKSSDDQLYGRPSDFTDTLFREVGVYDARRYLPDASGGGQAETLYFSNTRNLAYSQGEKGVIFEFDTAAMSPVEARANTRKPAWKMAWDEGEAELTLLTSPEATSRSVRSILVKSDATAPKGASISFQRSLDDLVENQGWKKVKVKEGTKYIRPVSRTDVNDVERVVHLAARRSVDANGTAPAFIHAEKTWTLPRPKTFFRDIGTIRNQLTDKLIFGGPTRAMQRRPLTRAIYKDEYTSMVNAGVDRDLAQKLADRNAVNITNEVMFNQNNESRFASKVDIIFPFQQPREELVRVWAPLIFNNKIRTIQLTNLGARMLENGVSSGTFYEYTNPFTGESEWRAKIPGSAALSRALGGVNAEFDFGLRDIFFLAQDNMGSTVGIPSPGGPFYSVVTRAFIDAFPEQYGNLPDGVKKYLFPFGASGELVRNEPNRLWMGFMGTPPPWEFASEFEQRSEYNKVQIHMFLHLRYEHWKETGQWKDPSQTEVEEATKAFFQTQALIGAVWPAPSRYIQPWQELVEAAKVDFVDPKTGEFDYFGFVNEHPNMAPFMTNRGEYVGPDDFKNWSRSDEERAEDAIKRWERTRSLKDFREELNRNRLTAQAWEERNLIPFAHADWEMDGAYIRWEEKWLKKLPDVVEQSRNNYFRDRDLHRIIHMADGAAKDRALDSWRKRYDVSFESYRFHVERLRKEGWEENYWRYSRPTDIVTAEVRSIIRGKGISEDAAVASLQPAEQYKYWRAQQAELVFYEGTDDPQDILDRYYLYANRVSDLYKKYPKLAGGSNDQATRIEKMIDGWRGDVRSQTDAIYDEIAVVSRRFDELKAAGKEWSAEGQALYAKRTALYDMIDALKNRQFRELPGILEYFDDMAAVTALMRDGKPTRQSQLAYQKMMSRPLGYGGYIPSNEELCRAPRLVRMAATPSVRMVSGRACSLACRDPHSAVTSVTAARAADSSTMALLSA